MSRIVEKSLFFGTAFSMSGSALVGVFSAFSAPPPDWTLPPPDPVEAAEIVHGTRTYVELDRTLVFDIGHGAYRAALRIAFAVELSPADLATVGAAVEQKEEIFVAQMTEDVLDYAEELSADATVDMLAKDLPPLLKHSVNRTLATEDIPVPVAEVLILELTIE